MKNNACEIKLLSQADSELESLCDILIDAIDSGASVGFLPQVSHAEIYAYWEAIQENLSENNLLFAAYVDHRLVGTVQLVLALKSNARHRAEVQKLLVLKSHRRQGIAQQLMAALEMQAKN